MPDQYPQLWNAGPVKITARGRQRASLPRTMQCAEPGCTNRRRTAQGAKYCEKHARSINYVLSGNGAPAEIKTCLRPGCNQTFKQQRRVQLRTDAGRVWQEFCPGCRNQTPLSLGQLRDHNVAPAKVSEWVSQGWKLKCSCCGKTLTRRHKGSAPVIDHDHRHCPGEQSCGECVRGVLCQDCNTKLGHLEGLIAADLLDIALAYLRG